MSAGICDSMNTGWVSLALEFKLHLLKEMKGEWRRETDFCPGIKLCQDQ